MLNELKNGDWIESKDRLYEVAGSEGEFIYAREVEYMNDTPKLRYGKPVRLNKCKLAWEGIEIVKEIVIDEELRRLCSC